MITRRAGLAARLARTLAAGGDITLVAESDGRDLTRVLRGHALDVILVDGQMPDALEACQDLRDRPGAPRPVVVAAPPGERWAVRAVEAGVRGIIEDDLPVIGADGPNGPPATGVFGRGLTRAILAVARGEMWVSRSVVSRAVEALLAGRQPWPPSGLLAGARLSRREVEVLGLTASGLSNQDTARRLGIAEATVKAHLTRVFRRVGVRNRVQLAALYHQGRRQDHRPEA